MSNQERRARYYAKAKKDPVRIDRIRALERERKRRQLQDPEFRKRYRERHRAWQHGITIEDVRALRARASCDICGTVTTGKAGWHIDHDHKTGAVRGLLCRRCNTTVLPAVEDSPHLIERAQLYLRCPPGIPMKVSA